MLPLYLDRVSGSLFVDAGNAWGPEVVAEGQIASPRESTLASVGGELSLRALPLWATLLELRLGLAVPLAETRPGVRDGATVYLRLGRSF